MKEVSKEKFYDTINKIPYTTSFLASESGCVRYNGKKGLFKGHCFAKRKGDKYYISSYFN